MVDDQDDMRLERATNIGYLASHPQIVQRPVTDSVDRRFGDPASPTQRTKPWYPSPPMSRPPSPPRPTSEAPTTTESTPAPYSTTSQATPPVQAHRSSDFERSRQTWSSSALSRPSSFGPRLQGPRSPDFPKPSSILPSSQYDPALLVEGSFAVERGLSSIVPSAFPARSGIAQPQAGPSGAHYGTPFSRPGDTPSRFDPTSTKPTTPAPPLTQRGARGNKSKAHVASACVNCKKAHLSCDVNRPCARCVASGKEDTCRDVQQKKRGRPRLRDETHSQREQIASDLGPVRQLTASIDFSPGPRRIAQPRRRRTNSIRSLPSQTSDEFSAGIYGPRYPRTGQPLLPGAYPQTYSPAEAPVSPFDTPTAFLDLDLTVIRANRAFYQATNISESMTGRDLGDAMTPTSPQGLAPLRLDLRKEREAREPALMPPMIALGQDPIEGVTEGDVDRLTSGFMDRTEMFMTRPSHSRPDPEMIRARVRLARARIYFVVVTIPPVRPAQAPSSMPAPVSDTLFATSDPLGLRRAAAPLIATSSSSPIPRPPPYPMQTSPPEYRRTTLSAYPPSSPSLGWRPTLPAPTQQYTSHLEHPPRIEGGPPRIPRAIDHFDTRPSLSPRSFLPPPQTTGPLAEPSSLSAQVPPVSEDEEEEDDRPPSSKRRKMDIHEVLQK